MTDVSVYPAGPARPTSGAGAVALLIGARGAEAQGFAPLWRARPGMHALLAPGLHFKLTPRTGLLVCSRDPTAPQCHQGPTPHWRWSVGSA